MPTQTLVEREQGHWKKFKHEFWNKENIGSISMQFNNYTWSLIVFDGRKGNDARRASSHALFATPEINYRKKR